MFIAFKKKIATASSNFLYDLWNKKTDGDKIMRNSVLWAKKSKNYQKEKKLRMILFRRIWEDNQANKRQNMENLDPFQKAIYEEINQRLIKFERFFEK